MKLKVASLVSKRKVILGQFRFGGVKSQLVTSQPALVAQDGRCVDSGTGHVEVQVTAHIHKLTLVGGLQFGTLLSKEGYTDSLIINFSVIYICPESLCKLLKTLKTS